MFIFYYFDAFRAGFLPLNKGWLFAIGKVFASWFGDQYVIIDWFSELDGT
jgi:hypothetical protein